MTRRWLRLDAQWDDTEWVMMLGPLGQLAWIKLLCYVKRDGRRGTAYALGPKAAAKKWGVPVRSVEEMLEAATKDEALCVVVDEGRSEKWEVRNWKEYQEPDRTAAKRKRRQRERESHGDVTGVTPPSRRDTVARDHRPPTTDVTAPSSEGAVTRQHTRGVDTVKSVRGMYGWQGSEGTDPLLLKALDDPKDRDRCLNIAIARMEAEGQEYQGRFFRRILETVIAEQGATRNAIPSAWESDAEYEARKQAEAS
jgi:hypothetical protein